MLSDDHHCPGDHERRQIQSSNAGCNDFSLVATRSSPRSPVKSANFLIRPIPGKEALWSDAGPRRGCLHTARLVAALCMDSCRCWGGQDRPAGEHGAGALLASYVESVHAMLVPAGVHASKPGGRREIVPASSFVFGEVS